LAVTIEAARAAGLVNKASVQRVIVDTTVMPKAIAHPTDSRLLESSRQHLIKAAQDNGLRLRLRQNYNRVAPRLAAQTGCYAHAKQFKRMKKAVRTLRTRVARVHREVARQLHAPCVGSMRRYRSPFLEMRPRYRPPPTHCTGRPHLLYD